MNTNRAKRLRALADLWRAEGRHELAEHADEHAAKHERGECRCRR